MTALPPIIFTIAGCLAVETIAYSLWRYLPGLLASIDGDE